MPRLKNDKYDIVLKNNLKEMRSKAGLTQDELADAIGVTRLTITSIETGRYCPSTRTALLLAKALNVDINELFYIVNNEKLKL